MINRLAGFPERAAARCRKSGRPFITLAYAQSLDGCITAHPGTRLDISGPQSTQFTHRLRAAHDAILVGIGTVIADDPRLTARHANGPHPQPIVLDSQARCPLSARLFDHPSHYPWIIVAPSAPAERVKALSAAGARTVALPTGENNRIDLHALVDWLGRESITSLMVEGGAEVITSFLVAHLVDQVILTLAPILVGGVHAINPLGMADPRGFPRLHDTIVEWMGDDLIVWGYLEEGPA